MGSWARRSRRLVLLDSFQRPLEDLRISVTDRCNFRCTYCMPLDEYEWIRKSEILTFEEITRVARIFSGLGVKKIRLTGGEPLLRRDLEHLIARLAELPGVELCLTTNGTSLAEKAAVLREAGLRRINVSIDTLDPEKFRRMTQRGKLAPVLDGLFAARDAGFRPIKINAVIEKGVNDEEVLDLVEFTRTNGFALRLIEYMDVGNANQWTSDKLVSAGELLAAIHAKYPLRKVSRARGTAPAVDYEFVDGRGDLGVIASVTEPFCGSCTRARLTADGKLVTCLFSSEGSDIKARLRSGADDDELRAWIESIWRKRNDRYSEERLRALQSDKGYQASERKKIEMITLGG